jgi:hypothetical protein
LATKAKTRGGNIHQDDEKNIKKVKVTLREAMLPINPSGGDIGDSKNHQKGGCGLPQPQKKEPRGLPRGMRI